LQSQAIKFKITNPIQGQVKIKVINPKKLEKYTKNNKHYLNADTVFFYSTPPSLNDALSSMFEFTQEKVK
jgi:hypothetical protein